MTLLASKRIIYIGSTAIYISSSMQFNSAPHKGTLMHNFLGTNLFKPMNVFGSLELHCLVRKHFGEQFAVYGCGSGHQFCNHAKVFNTKQKNNKQNEPINKVKLTLARLGSSFCCNAGISADRCSKAGLPIWVPCANIFNFGSPV